MMLNKPCKASKIQFYHQCPANNIEQRRLLGDNIIYSASEQFIEFDIDFWSLPSPFVNSQLSITHEHQAKLQQEIKKQYLFLLQIKACIIENLSLHKVTITNIASNLNISERKLKSSLADIKCSYTEVLEDTRQELASQLLSQLDIEIKDVAFRCGYAEPSVFNRAFKRWYNVTPRQYQQNLTIDNST